MKRNMINFGEERMCETDSSTSHCCESFKPDCTSMWHVRELWMLRMLLARPSFER